MSDTPLLQVRNLVTTFHTASGPVFAVRDVSFDLRAGETLAIVGESGSGKSVTAMSLLNMVRHPGRVGGGQVLLGGRDLLKLGYAELRKVRGGEMGLVFQDPVGSLNPLMRVRHQLTEAILAHESVSRQQAEQRAVALMTKVGIPDPEARLADYPLAFSGGMSQRVMIAMALANNPKVIIADEPTTALDVTIQAQILELLADLNRDSGTAVILITHNLGIVARLCQRVAVMYAGQIVEEGTTEQIFAAPHHPYTRDLLGATPSLRHPRSRPLVAIEGRPPTMRSAFTACPYAPRDPLAFDKCHSEAPPLLTDANGHRSACWLKLENGQLPPRPLTPRVPDTTEATAEAAGSAPLLSVRALAKSYPAGGRTLFGRPRTQLRAVDGISFDLASGETLGLVGESGCGKSTVAKLVLGIEEPTAGDIEYDGQRVTGLRGAAQRDYNRKVQLVFQNPMSSLNPRMTVGQAIAEPMRAHGISGAPAHHRVRELLGLVGMDPDAADRYPHEFSGGQRQRVVIARALAVDPRLIVCDEAVAALDVSLQAQVINLLRELQTKLDLSYLFIGHDLASVRHVASRMLVMYLGEVVESAPSEELTAAPLHPYTASLLSAVPEPDPQVERHRERIVLQGEVPTPLNPPAACRFHTRCPIGPRTKPERGICATTKPALREVSAGRLVACHFPGELSAVASIEEVIDDDARLLPSG
jgi:peptide/nickel transport system ATP-binding protein